MKNKQLNKLIIITLISLILALGVFAHQQMSQRANLDTQLISNFDKLLKETKYIEFSSSNTKTIIELVNNNWIITNFDNLPVETNLLKKFFFALRSSRIKEKKTNNLELFYKLGLDNKNKTSVILKDTNFEIIYSLDTGIYNYNIPGTYIKKNNEDISYLASGDLSLNTDPTFWVKK